MDDFIRKRRPAPRPAKRGRPKGVGNGQGKGPAGRPCSYDPKLHPLLMTYMRREGVTEKDACALLDINISTMQRWKKDFPEFAKACNFERLAELENVTRSLYKMTQGWEYIETKRVKERIIVDKLPTGTDIKGRPTFAPIYGEDWMEVRVETQTKRVLPQIESIKFYLSSKHYQGMTPGQGRDVGFGSGWRRSDPPPAKPGAEDGARTQEELAAMMMKFSVEIMGAV